jgi:hypothetical protein
MSELGDRIAAVQAQHHHWDYAGAVTCACGVDFGLGGNAGWEAAVKDWAQHVADAVIEALDLRIEDKYKTASGQKQLFGVSGFWEVDGD